MNGSAALDGWRETETLTEEYQFGRFIHGRLPVYSVHVHAIRKDRGYNRCEQMRRSRGYNSCERM